MTLLYAAAVTVGSVIGVVTFGLPGLVAGYVAGFAGAVAIAWRRDPR